jgi:tRNA A-37 threonylcarbamoyl transferase component Bud32
VYPDFILLKRPSASIWIGNKYADPVFVDRLADADRLFEDPSCRIIKDQRKIKVARVEVMIGGKAQSIYVKRYNAFSLRSKLFSPFRHSGASRSLQGAAILDKALIRTAPPVAAVENRSNGILTKSFFISEEIVGAKTADLHWLENVSAFEVDGRLHRRREFIHSLALLFHSLHERGIYHNDLKDANILVVCQTPGSSPVFYLLDLEGIRIYHQLSERRRIKNLVQLNRTLGRYLRRSDKLAFIKNYFGVAYQHRSETIRVIRRIIVTSDRLDMAKGLPARSGTVAREFNRG